MSLMITNAGIAASAQAGELGIRYKITHISIGTEGYLPTADQTTLRNEVLRKPITRGTIFSLGQLHFETVWDGDEEFDGKELGYWLEDGTLFAVDSRDGAVITFKRKDTVVTEACELNLAASSIDNISVELLGSPYATEEVAGIAKIASNTDIEQGTNDRSFLTIKKLIYALDVSHVIDKLVTNLWLKMAAKIFPVGAAIPWFTDTAPDGFAIMKNQAFDTAVYTELSKVWTNGVIPDMRGCSVIGKEDDETVGIFEEGQVKQHGHPGSSSGSTNLGNKNSNTTGNHTHTYTAAWGGRTENVLSRGAVGHTTTTLRSNAAGNHKHYTTMGAHAHSIAIALFGSAKNTINHRKVNWIVRMA